MNTILEDFHIFFEQYKNIWNSCDLDNMISLLSPDLSIRWAGPGPDVSDWGYEQSRIGWKEAYKQYEGKQPKWSFRELLITPANQNEVIAIFWVTFSLEGKTKDVVKLFTQRFRREKSGWKLMREYCESLNPNFISVEIGI